MTLIFPEGDKVYRLEIKPVDRVMEGHIGYRRMNQLLLRKDVFDEFVYYCTQDNFPAMRNIVTHLIDVNAKDLTWEPKQNQELSWQP